MILIGISGKKGVGKDLLASFLKQKYGFVNLPFAGELKERVRQDFNLTKEHTDGKLKESDTTFISSVQHYLDSVEVTNQFWSPRDIMIAYGQFFRQFDKLWWVKKTFQKIDSINAIHPNTNDVRITISDVRFKNEANYIKSQGGFLVRLERKPELNIYKEQSTDISETDLDDYKDFDFRLPAEQNITPSDLESFAAGLLDNVLTKQAAIAYGFPA